MYIYIYIHSYKKVSYVITSIIMCEHKVVIIEVWMQSPYIRNVSTVEVYIHYLTAVFYLK